MKRALIAAASCALAGAMSVAAPNVTPKDTLVYVGTRTGSESNSAASKGTASKGIYLFRLQTDNLEVSQNITLVPLGLAVETPNASSIEIDTTRRVVFASNEIDEFQGKPTGTISAFAIDPATGTLTLLNQRPSGGKGPRHLILDRERTHALVANAGSGSVAVLPIGSDGKLGEPTAIVQHMGKSVHPERQTGPHPQSLTLDPANRFAFACDLGADKIFTYKFDAQKGTLTPNTPASVSLKPGAGPANLVFRPDGRFAFVVNELNSTIVAYAYDAAAGALKELQTISTLPDYFDGVNAAGELGIHPSGKYLYVSNNGHNSVVLFGIDAEQGTLTYVEEQGTGGKNPRHFGIEPTAKHLAIANRDSDTVLVCRIDAGNGRLKPSGVFASVVSPLFVKFLSPAEAGR